MADEKDKAAGAEEKKPESSVDEKDTEEKGTSTTEELDLDKELEEEEKRGKPDPTKARERFEKKGKRKEDKEDADDDADEADNKDAAKPVTQEDLARATEVAEDRAYKRLQADQASEIANRLGKSDKEGRLIFLKWQNRTFPAGMPLADQLNEAYAIVHSRRIVSERNEALRALAGKGSKETGSAETHRDGPTAGEPKMSDADRSAITAAGFKWDPSRRLYLKKVGRGFVFKDPKTGKTWNAAA